MPNTFTVMFRTFEKEYIYVNETLNGTNEQVSSHLAIIMVSNGYGTDYYSTASCITFIPKGMVPAGKKYNVRVIRV